MGAVLLEMVGGPRAEVDLLVRWRSVAPELRGLRPEGFDARSGTLTLRALSPAWETQARLAASKIPDQLNARLGAEVVRKLVLLKALPDTGDHRGARQPLAAGQESTSPEPVDVALQAAAQRQAQCAPREAEADFAKEKASYGRRRPSRTTAVRARALFRARNRPQA